MSSEARPGFDRTDAPYVWPPNLVRGTSPARIVYLDLNHWIALAKAAVGHRDGEQHLDALELLRAERSADRVVLPLSLPHCMEMSGIKDPRQRANVAGVMEELTAFVCIQPRSVIVRLELEAALDALGWNRDEPYAPIPLLGRGVLQALGLRGGVRIRASDGRDVTDRAKQDWPGGPEAFERWADNAERQLDRSALAGPSDDEAPELRRLGWDPTVARAGAQKRAEQEIEQAGRLAGEPRWRRGRLRDVTAARYLTLEAEPMVTESFSARGATVAQILSERDALRRFVDSMPSADAYVSYVTLAHRNPHTRWTGNDIFDIDALSVAIPYCDIVGLDSHAIHLAQAAGLPDRLGTSLVASLEELATALRGSGPRRN